MAQRLKILVVEDEKPILQGLVDVFVYHGYEVDTATDGSEGLEKAIHALESEASAYDLILLDVMLPSLDGFSICNEIRARNRSQPIVMLTAKTSDEDIINGLTLGADDYIGKPFSVRELVLRVEAVLRRSQKLHLRERELLIGSTWKVDTSNLTGQRLASKDTSVTVIFTRREIEILQYLKANSDRPVSRDELLEKVWGYKKASLLETRTVDIHIAKLRKKIEPDPKEPSLLVTIRGEGYRILEG